MNRKLHSLLSWAGPQIVIAVTVFFAADTAARHQQSEDFQRQSQIATTYAMDAALGMTEIAVTVHGKEALLTGTVANRAEKDKAEKLALAVAGIERVDNRLEIAAGSSLRQRARPGQHAFAFAAKIDGRGTMTGKTA